MKYLLLLLTFLLVSCEKNNELDRVKSPDGEFTLVSSVNDENIIQIVVMKGENELRRIRTGASIYSKYAIGWYYDENVIVLNSSDIGTYAWSYKDEFSERISQSSFSQFGKELYEAKYK